MVLCSGMIASINERWAIIGHVVFAHLDLSQARRTLGVWVLRLGRVALLGARERLQSAASDERSCAWSCKEFDQSLG